jgi:hypothetical protein
LRNADPHDMDSAIGVFDNLFFSENLYDLGEVG